MSKLIKADRAPIIEVKKVLTHVGGVEGLTDENALFCPFSVEDVGGEQDADQNTTVEQPDEVEAPTEALISTPSDEVQHLAEEVLREAKEEARRLREEAEDFLENARRKAEEIESQAYNSGFEQGRKDGEELGKRQFEVICNRLRSLIESLSSQAQGLIGKYEEQMVRLCMKIAQKVVAVELRTRPETILEVMRRAWHEVQEANEIKVFLHPKDLEVVKDAVLEGMDLTGGHKLEFLPNEGVRRGGCIIETEFGLLDATLDARWQAIEESIEEALSRELRGQDAH